MKFHFAAGGVWPYNLSVNQAIQEGWAAWLLDDTAHEEFAYLLRKKKPVANNKRLMPGKGWKK